MNNSGKADDNDNQILPLDSSQLPFDSMCMLPLSSSYGECTSVALAIFLSQFFSYSIPANLLFRILTEGFLCQASTTGLAGNNTHQHTTLNGRTFNWVGCICLPHEQRHGQLDLAYLTEFGFLSFKFQFFPS
jgi:hypothetical protein